MADTGDVLESPALDPVEAEAYRFPWPPREDGLLDAFARTWVDSLFHPRRFFAAMPPGLPLRDTLLYFLPIGVLAAAIGLFWRSLAVSIGGFDIAKRLGEDFTGPAPLLEFLFSPLLLLLGLFLTTAIVHAMLFLLRDGERGFGVTLRVFAFVYGAELFGVVPGLGDAVGAVWMPVVAVIGLRAAHRTQLWKAILALVIPLIIFSILLAIAFLIGALATGLSDLPVR